MTEIVDIKKEPDVITEIFEGIEAGKKIFALSEHPGQDGKICSGSGRMPMNPNYYDPYDPSECLGREWAFLIGAVTGDCGDCRREFAWLVKEKRWMPLNKYRQMVEKGE